MRKPLALLAVLLLIFGCAMPWEQQKPPEITQGTRPPPLQLPAENASNATNATQVQPQNQTPTAPANETPGQPEPEKPKLIPRSVSDNIGEGQFELADQSGAPFEMHVINAGQADSVLLRKGEFAMLIDDGNGELVNPYLQKLGVRRLEILVATKDSPDAISGIYGLMDLVDVKEFWENGVEKKSAEYGALVKKAEIMKAAIKRPAAGGRMNFSGLEILALNPQTPRLAGNPDTDAIVLMVKNGGFCAVLLNPTVQERENALISAAGSESLRCPVATYFRHGEGRPSPSIIVDRIAPKDVIISVGQNDEKLPSQTTLTWLNMSGMKIWRTDTDGTVKITNYGYVSYEISGGN